MYWRTLHRHDHLWLGGQLAGLIDVRPGLAAAPCTDCVAVPESEADPVPPERPAASSGAVVIHLPG
jgi:hypothetical protein